MKDEKNLQQMKLKQTFNFAHYFCHVNSGSLVYVCRFPYFKLLQQIVI